MRVKVYFNLHRKLFSVVALEGPNKGLVIAHRAEVFVRDAIFKVSEAGRQRVLREKQKNIHAFVVGKWCEISDPYYWYDSYLVTTEQVSYNPYLYGHFVRLESRKPIYRARGAWLANRSVRVPRT